MTAALCLIAGFAVRDGLARLAARMRANERRRRGVL